MELYKLTFPNNKSYIGITSRTAIERFKEHCDKSSNCKMVRNAINKYGKENVIITVLGVFNNWELLCLAEREAIEKYQTFSETGKGYNLTLGGDGVITVDIYGDERVIRDKEMRSLYKKEWCERNKDRLSKRRADYYQQNKEKLKLKAKTYHEQNKEKCLARNREYAKLNSQENSARAGQYQRDNREKTNEKNRLWKASRTPEQKAEINRKRRETRKAKKMLELQTELAG